MVFLCVLSAHSLIMLAPSTKFSAASITVKLVIDDGGRPKTQKLKLVLEKEQKLENHIELLNSIGNEFSMNV